MLGGSGQGEQMAANKVAGVRAALCNDLYTARMAREHNDANVLSMGGRIVGPGLADEIVDLLPADRRTRAAATSAASTSSARSPRSAPTAAPTTAISIRWSRASPPGPPAPPKEHPHELAHRP